MAQSTPVAQPVIPCSSAREWLDTSLRQKYPDREIQSLLEPFEALGDDHDFWKHTFDGLCVLGGAGSKDLTYAERPPA